MARRNWLVNGGWALACAALGGLGGWAFEAHRMASDPAGSLSPQSRAAMEQVVHDYIMAHPDILPKAMAEADRRQNAFHLSAIRDQVESAGAGTVLGNPQGKIVLVEFTDYACGYCRKSVADVDALIAANPDLKVVVRELPILTPASADAAKMAIAAAEQGHYPQFHKAMFESGHPDQQSIAAAAQAAGLDLARAQKSVAAPGVEAELVRNLDLARQLGFTGTPSWVVGDTIMTGAVGQDQLSQAVASARG